MSKFFTINFQKLPNLVTLLSCDWVSQSVKCVNWDRVKYFFFFFFLLATLKRAKNEKTICKIRQSRFNFIETFSIPGNCTAHSIANHRGPILCRRCRRRGRGRWRRHVADDKWWLFLFEARWNFFPSGKTLIFPPGQWTTLNVFSLIRQNWKLASRLIVLFASLGCSTCDKKVD